MAEHRVVDIDLRAFGGSALTDDIAVPKDRSVEALADIPVTYVPARNTIFLSFALAFAEVLGSSDVFIGVNALDYSGYPDCRPEFIAAFETMARLATKAGVEGTQHLAHPRATGRDDEGGHHPDGNGARCRFRHDAELLRPVSGWLGVRLLRLVSATCAQGFADAGIGDPTRYASGAALMGYVVKEVFATLQGEGFNTGRVVGVLPIRRLQPLDRS